MNQLELYKRNVELLYRANVPYREVEHEPVLDYEAAAKIRERFGLTGIESKSLFLRFRDGRYAMFITVKGRRLEPKRIKDLCASRPSLCSDAELIEKTACVPKCACPFGHAEDITLIIDEEVFAKEKFLYSPGPPEKTIEILTSDIRKILQHVHNPVFTLTSE